MANLNKVMLIGNLTRDPELRVTPKGTAVCQFSLAINRRWKDETGFDREEVTYVDCDLWGKRGEALAKYSAKGQSLFVEGRLRLEQWEDKTTKEKRSRMKVSVENFEWLNHAAKREDGQATPAAVAPKPAENLDEDVPY